VVLTGCNLTAHLFSGEQRPDLHTPASPPNATTLEFDNSANFTTNDQHDLRRGSAQLLLFEEAVWFIADSGARPRRFRRLGAVPRSPTGCARR
jgi:hypothetical protein